MPRFSTVRMPLVVSRRLTQRLSVSTQKRCVCRFGRKRRRVLLLAWETRFPTAGFLPVTSQTRDIRLPSEITAAWNRGGFPEPRFIPARRRDHKSAGLQVAKDQRTVRHPRCPAVTLVPRALGPTPTTNPTPWESTT